MTTLPICDAGGAILPEPLAWCETLGVMHFPGDVRKAEAFANSMAASHTLRCMAEDDTARTECKARHFSDIVKCADQFRPLLKEAEISVRPAFHAARVLWIALRFGVHFPEWGSINKAVQIVCREDLSPRTRVMDSWGRFKPVAHLWTAHMLASDEQSESVLSFLSRAEALRRQAEGQIVRGARAPLLAPGIAIKVPTHIEIRSASLAIPAPDQWMIEELGGAQLVQVRAS